MHIPQFNNIIKKKRGFTPLEISKTPSKKAESLTGFTLTEAFASVIILSICAIALFASLYTGLNLVNDMRENIIASSIIQDEMEKLRKTPFLSLPPSGTSVFYNNSLALLYNSSGTRIVDQYIDANMVRIAIIVRWNSRLNTDKQNTKRLVTLITKDGINSI